MHGLSHNEAIAAFIGQQMRDRPVDFLVLLNVGVSTALSEMSHDEWTMVREFLLQPCGERPASEGLTDLRMLDWLQSARADGLRSKNKTPHG